VYDGDNELLRTFATKDDALAFTEKRPEFIIKIVPKTKPTETDYERMLRLNGDALL
jgi:hypothetical protein